MDTWAWKRLRTQVDCVQFITPLLKGEKRKSGRLERLVSLGIQLNGRALVQGGEFILQYCKV